MFILIFTLAVSTRTVFAEVNDYGLKDTAKMAGIPVGETSPIKIVATVINVILGLVGVLAVVLIIYAGFAWMTAAGNEEKIGKAKKVLTGAVIGLLIIMASFIISSFIVRNVMEATKSTESLSPNQQLTGNKTCTDLKGTCVDPQVTGSCSDTTKTLAPTSDCSSPKACCFPSP